MTSGIGGIPRTSENNGGGKHDNHSFSWSGELYRGSGKCFATVPFSEYIWLERVVAGPHDLRCIESLALLFSGIGGAASLVWCPVAKFGDPDSSEIEGVAHDSMVDGCKQYDGGRGNVSGLHAPVTVISLST